MVYQAGLLEFAVLASMKRAERDRAQLPLVMTMLPGPAAQKGAVAALAVTTQARDGLKRERRVADDVVTAVTDATSGAPPLTVDKLREYPALRSIATDGLAARINEIPPPSEIVKQAAAMVAAAIALPKDTKIPEADAQKEFPLLMAVLDDDTVKLLVV